MLTSGLLSSLNVLVPNFSLSECLKRYKLTIHVSMHGIYPRMVGCVAQLVERRSLTGELSLSCARPAADG